jgi:hypothetical protein
MRNRRVRWRVLGARCRGLCWGSEVWRGVVLRISQVQVVAVGVQKHCLLVRLAAWVEEAVVLTACLKICIFALSAAVLERHRNLGSLIVTSILRQTCGALLGSGRSTCSVRKVAASVSDLYGNRVEIAY